MKHTAGMALVESAVRRFRIAGPDRVPLNQHPSTTTEPPRPLELSQVKAGAQEEAVEVAVVAIAVLALPVLPHHPWQLCRGGWV